MKNIYLLTLLASTAAFGQTRLISHKSHSGSMATFNRAFENNLFDIEESNFGEPPPRFSIDSIILLEDNRAVIISSLKEFARVDNIEYKEGRDTVSNHPLLSKRHAKDSIEKILVPPYSSKKIVLVNYDNNKTKKNNLLVMPNKPGAPNMPLMVAALAALSILFGFVFYMAHKLKSVRLA